MSLSPGLLRLALLLAALAVAANAGPVVSSLNPPYIQAGGPDVTLTVSGSGFVQGSTVYLSSIALATSFVDSTKITAVIPASLSALAVYREITVHNPDGSVSPYLYFDVQPVLTGATPNSAPAGSPTTPVTITGIGFANGISLEIVTASSTSDIFSIVQSSTTMTAFIDASLLTTPGVAKIQVYDTNYPNTATLPFTITAAAPGKATLTSLVPASVAAGGSATNIQINGSGFASGCTALWNGTAISTTVINAAQVSAQIPAALTALPGSGSITVVNPGAAASGALTFTVTPQTAFVRSLSPGSAVAGSPAFTLTVNAGPNSFLSGGSIFSGAVVQWNGTPLVTMYVSSTQLTAQVPASLIATPGTANVTIVNPGASPGNTVVFTIVAGSPPALSSLSPTSATAGSSALTLTLSGSNFFQGATVSWNGSLLATTFVSSTQLTAQVTANLLSVAGSAAITVLESGVPASSALTFTVSPPSTATLASISPSSVPAGSPGFTLNATGTGFVTGSVMQWNGGPVATSFVSSTQLTAQIPADLAAAAAGTATVQVVNPSAALSNSLRFTIAAPTPAISSLSPNSAAAGSPAFSLTVNGSGFVSGAIVQWNGSTLATTFVSATQLTAEVPAANNANAVSANITVLNPGSAASNALTFTVSAASLARPVVQRVLNAASYTQTLAPGTWASIFGTQLAVSTASAPTVPLPLTLAEVSSVTVGGVAAPLSYVSPGQINFVIPFEAVLGSSVPVVVTTADGASAPVNITLVRNAPALFTQNAQGTGMAVAFNANFQPITSMDGGAIILYGVGLGPTNPPASTAQGGASAEPLNRVADEVQVFIGEVPCLVLFAGLAPGYPGIYQLNVIPPAAPASNRLYIVENGVTSNVTTLPIEGGTNVTNVQGSIDGMYPASGIYSARNADKPTDGPVSFSEMLNAGAATVSFDIRPNAQPFTVTAVGPGAIAFLQIDPASGTWQGYVTSPSPVARIGDFSLSGSVVYDLLSGTPFPGNVIPLSRFDPIEARAANLLPFPNVFPSTPSPNATFLYASRPLMQSGHFSIGSGQTSDDLSNLYFGGFVNIGQPPPSIRTAQFLLYVDGMLVATKDVSYPVQ
jgi:uncharacterized protein (TIGR03437 family)